MRKILFVVKKRPAICYSYGNYGLKKSAEFISNKLEDLGYQSKVVEAIDNNCIDRLVTEYKATDVFIEALFVVPSKMEILAKLHPKVKFIIRIHSQIPFLSGEGIAFEWIKEYQRLGKKYNIRLAGNSERFCSELEGIGIDCLYTPNIYFMKDKIPYKCRKRSDTVHISSPGAIRPLKNTLVQAVAAITFAESIGKRLEFHINATRTEQKGDNVLKNIRALFVNSPHKLVEHDWYSHDEFLKMLQNTEIVLQISFTETFNIVAADAVTVRVPVITSREVSWLPAISKVSNPTYVKAIVSRMYWAYYLSPVYTALNTVYLDNYNLEATRVWLDLLKFGC